MSDSLSSLDYGQQLVLRYRGSGLSRKDFAEQSDISVSTLDYYVRRERKASQPADFAANRILPVELVAPGEVETEVRESALSTRIRIRVTNGRVVEVERGFDA